MISLPCTSCKTVLQIDDAFAGGVCRCQHCGTIQTVPAKARAATRSGAAGGAGAGPKTLYQKNKPSSAQTTASIAAAFSPPPPESRTRAAHPMAPAKKLPVTMLVAVAVALLVLVGVIIWLVTRPAV